MKTRLLSTVAATMLIGIGAASAQAPGHQATPERAPAAQQSAPAEKIAPSMKAPETTGQSSSDSKMDRGSSGSLNRSSDSNKSSETSGQAPKAADQGSGGSLKSSSDTKSPSGAQTQRSGSDNQRGAVDNKSDTNKSATDSTKSQNQSTTGQGAAAGQAKLTTEQRTKITSVIRSQKVERVEPSQLNVSINVGTRIPSSVRVHRLPQEVVTVYPEWRGYDYILVSEQIVIIDPRSHEIVFIIDA